MSVMVTIQLPEEEDKTVLAEVMRATSETVAQKLGVAPQAVHVKLIEMPHRHFSIGGQLYEE